MLALSRSRNNNNQALFLSSEKQADIFFNYLNELKENNLVDEKGYSVLSDYFLALFLREQICLEIKARLLEDLLLFVERYGA